MDAYTLSILASKDENTFDAVLRGTKPVEEGLLDRIEKLERELEQANSRAETATEGYRALEHNSRWLIHYMEKRIEGLNWDRDPATTEFTGPELAIRDTNKTREEYVALVNEAETFKLQQYTAREYGEPLTTTTQPACAPVAALAIAAVKGRAK